jgi:DNA-binding transcriptional LysR family regulator
MLEYFVAVAEEGQMTRAARRLEVAQPALSQAISQLEGEFGLKLFDRHARGVTLTAAGAILYGKAKLAVEETREAGELARSLARAQAGTIEFGFVGSPPGLHSPHAMQAFTDAYPEIEIRYRELPFPTSPTSRWLSEVDVAACHLPPVEEGVWVKPLISEPRVVLAPRRHHLAERAQLSVDDVLDERWIGFDAAVAPAWAGFWSLDDHRGCPPQLRTADAAANPQEVLAALAMSDAITTVPASVARVIANFLSAVAVIPLHGAAPSQIALAGHDGRTNQLVEKLLAFRVEGLPAPVAVDGGSPPHP